MGDTEKGSWTSRELGRHINEEQVRAAERMGHTPGPWYVSQAQRLQPGNRTYAVFTVLHSSPERGKLICEGGNAERGFVEESRANARLIAAAPELLEALQSLQRWAEMMGGWEAPAWILAKQAIAKATGDTDASR